VTELFTATFEVGGDASVGSLAEMFSDLQVVAQGGLDLTTSWAQADADGRISYLAGRGGLDGLRQQARLHNLPALEDAAELVNDAVYWPDIPPWRRERLDPYGLPWVSTAAAGAFGPEWARLLNQLREAEIAARLPDRPYRFRSVRYENPLIVEIISAAGGAAGLGILLQIIRDWRPRQRITRAVAADVEDQAWTRTQLRRILVEQAVRGDLALTPEIANSLMSDSLVDAVGRLSSRSRELERRQIPDDS
jgi:hypothetical protein